MRSVVQQSVTLSAAAESLFEMYLDPAAHSAITGSPVTIGAEPGSAFRAFDGQLSGTLLAVARPNLIVQSWRSTKFHADDLDSTLILSFVPVHSDATSGRIELVHLDVPDHDLADVTEGWPKHYWRPWRAYLERLNSSEVRSPMR
ncbi:MAG: SRPBCC domain-containing protein [Pirellulales bacterium]